jgi:hypothetical protein
MKAKYEEDMGSIHRRTLHNLMRRDGAWAGIQPEK